MLDVSFGMYSGAPLAPAAAVVSYEVAHGQSDGSEGGLARTEYAPEQVDLGEVEERCGERALAAQSA